MSAAPRARSAPSTWAVVLAAGDGSRLSSLTRDWAGIPVPKQYCSLNGDVTLLQQTLARAAGVAPEERIAVVVAEQHRRWWKNTQPSIPNGHTVIQPANRGTANGILLAALSIAVHDPLARLVFLPSDHYIEDESLLAGALQAAAHRRLSRGTLMLLGLEPTGPDPELGYIVPRSTIRPLAHGKVKRMVEKPPARLASALLAEGALWNSFIFAAEVATIADLVRARHPKVVADFERAIARGPYHVTELYEKLTNLDFSRHILQGAEAQLSVLRVPQCGWSDLGTPRSVAACLERLTEESWGGSYARNADLVSLAAAVAPAAMQTQ
jgi:mannose-1-phosphate guanylyltransferase